MLKTTINVPSGTSAVRAEQLLLIDSGSRDSRRLLLSVRRLPLQVGYAEVFELPELFRYDLVVLNTVRKKNRHLMLRSPFEDAGRRQKSCFLEEIADVSTRLCMTKSSILRLVLLD
jgi:hypothetical protein